MENTILICGFNELQEKQLREIIPSTYEVKLAENITDMIVTSALCCLVDGADLSAEEYRLLRNYCTEVAGYSNELIVWVGDDPPCDIISVCKDFNNLIAEISSILSEAKQHYETQDMYSTPYALLPKRAIEASLEEAISAGLQWRFPDSPNQQITKRMRQEWVSLLEADAAVELAAVHELSIWLRRAEIPYFMEGGVTSGLIPYLLGITKVNPLPVNLGGCDLVWQSFCSFGNSPDYMFHLPESVKDQVERWIEKHWIKELYLESIDDIQITDFDTLNLMHMHFCFDAEETLEPCIPEFCREDVYYYLIRHGFIEKDAFRGMESVRKGFGYPLATDDMLQENDPILELGARCRYLPARSNLMERLEFARLQKRP